MKLHSFKVYNNIEVPGKSAKTLLTDVFVPYSETALPVIIFSHGFKGFKDWGPFNNIASLFAEAGFVFVKFNFSFNGTTSELPLEFADLDAFGNNNFTKELDDLENIIDWVISEKKLFTADRNSISLLGHSRGGGISLLKAAEDDRISSVATWAAVADFGRFITNHDIETWKQTGVHYIENARTGQMMPLYLQLYFDFINNRERLDVVAAVNRLKKPVLIVHGTADETVDLSHALELQVANSEKATLVTIDGGDHTFGAAHPHSSETLPPHFNEVVDKTIRFFQSV